MHFSQRPIANSHGIHPNFSLSQDSTDQKVKGILNFDIPLCEGGAPQGYDLHYLTFNAYALTREQCERMYGEPSEEFRSICITEPTKNLRVLTHFAENVSPERFSIKVYRPNNILNFAETDWCTKALYWSQMSRTLSLEINKPLFDHEYRIAWDLPQEIVGSKKHIVDQVFWQAEKIKRDLLRIKQQPTEDSIYRKKILERLDRILNEFFPKEKNLIDIGIMVFDDQIKKLTPVVGRFPQDYWGLGIFVKGKEWVGEKPHKLHRAQLFVKSKTKLEQNYYASPPSSLPHHEALLSIPLLFPLDGPFPTKAKSFWGCSVLVPTTIVPYSLSFGTIPMMKT